MTQATMEPAPPSYSLTVEELAKRVEGALEGNGEALILGASSIEDADFGDVVFAENARRLSEAEKSRASAIIAFLDATTPDKPLIKVDNPRHAFAKILELFAPRLNAPPGIHPTAVIGQNVRLGANVSIGPHVVLGDNVCIGDRTVLMASVYVGDYCQVGEDCILYPNVTLNHGAVLRQRVIVHSGTVIGADGFGYMRIGEHSYKIPQIGNVVVEEEVEIGANCTIDRAKTGSTLIGARTKIDNLVHIAHNVKIGPDCIIVAQVGIAGSSQLGRGVTLAGQAGVKDHVTIGDGAVVLAQAGLFGDVAPGEVVSGYPARPHREKLRQDAAAANLPDYVKRIRALEKANADLAARSARLEQLVRTLAEKAGASLEEREAEGESDVPRGPGRAG